MDPYVQMVMGEQERAQQQAAAVRQWHPLRANSVVGRLVRRVLASRGRPAPESPARVVRPVQQDEPLPRHPRPAYPGGIACLRCCTVVPADDIALQSAGGQGLCLFCYGRETGTGAPVPQSLRRQVLAVLATIPAVSPTGRD